MIVLYLYLLMNPTANPLAVRTPKFSNQELL